MPVHLKDSDLPESNEKVKCGRHMNRSKVLGIGSQESLTRGRIDDAFYDIPDSEGDSDSTDHPLEGATVLARRELAQILKAKA